MICTGWLIVRQNNKLECRRTDLTNKRGIVRSVTCEMDERTIDGVVVVVI